jgi:hypothetical protein
MAVYRFYIIDLVGQLVRSMRCECPDDNAAIKQAEHTHDASSVELWQDERRIGRFGPAPVELHWPPDASANQDA